MQRLHWTTVVLILFFILAAFGLGYFIKWMTCPFGQHICVSPTTLATDYSQFWYMFGGLFGVIALVIIALLWDIAKTNRNIRDLLSGKA